MAHMFAVDYICNHVSGLVETGKVIVLAESHEQAHDIATTQLNLPPSRTRCESSKIKPPCYVAAMSQYYPNSKVSVRSQRDAPLAPTHRFHITVDANTHGQSEQQVLRKIGEELQARGAQTKLRHNIPMSIACETVDAKASAASPMEKIEMYGRQGGRVTGGRTGSK
jgi:hypothetical protein